MKKLISIVLIFALALSLCCLFSGCDNKKLGLKYAKKDPYAYIQTASEQLQDELSAETDLSKLLNSLLEKGTINVKTDDMTAEIAYNLKKNSAYADVEYKTWLNDTESIQVWYDEDALCFKAPDLLDSDKAYGISFDTLEKDLENSELWGSLGDDYGDISDDLGAMGYLALFGEDGGIDELTKSYNKVVEKFFDKLKYTVSETTTGEDEKAVKISFTLDSDDLVELFESLEEDVFEDIDLSELLDIDFDQIAETLAEIDLEMECSVVIGNSSGRIVSYSCDCEYEYEYKYNYNYWTGTYSTSTETVHIEMKLDLEDLKDISLKLEVESDGNYVEDGSIVIKLKNNDEDDKIDRKLTVKKNGKTVAALSVIMDSSKKKFSVSYSDKDDSFELEGRCEMSKSKLRLYKMTYTVDNREEDLPFEELTLSTSCTIKKMPKYTNILKMDEDELEELLGSLIGF